MRAPRRRARPTGVGSADADARSGEAVVDAPVVHRDHHASPCGRWVYCETQLWRPERPALGWVLDHAGPGPIGRGAGLLRAADVSRRLGAGGAVVTYLCALRVDGGPDLPADALSAVGTTVTGPETILALRTMARTVREVVCAWGDLPVSVPALRLAAETAAAALLVAGTELRCLGCTEAGLPLHPRAVGDPPPPLRSWPPLGPPTLPGPLWRSG